MCFRVSENVAVGRSQHPVGMPRYQPTGEYLIPQSCSHQKAVSIHPPYLCANWQPSTFLVFLFQ